MSLFNKFHDYPRPGKQKPLSMTFPGCGHPAAFLTPIFSPIYPTFQDSKILLLNVNLPLIMFLLLNAECLHLNIN